MVVRNSLKRKRRRLLLIAGNQNAIDLINTESRPLSGERDQTESAVACTVSAERRTFPSSAPGTVDFSPLGQFSAECAKRY